MRMIAFNKAMENINRAGIDLNAGSCLEIGGSREVYLETLNPAPEGKRNKILRKLGFKIPVQRAIVRAINPLLEMVPNLVMLDGGFNELELGTGQTIKADFLDYGLIKPLANKYDTVFSFDTLEHVSDPFKFCRHLMSVVKPGGTIYVSTVFSHEYHPSPQDYFRYSPEGLRMCFQGIENVAIEGAGWEEEGLSVWLMARKK